MPLHLRYHGASSTDAAYEDILLPPPRLFLRCDRPPHQNPLSAAAAHLLNGMRLRSDGQDWSPCPPFSLIGDVWEDICFLRSASARFQRDAVPAMQTSGSADIWHQIPSAKRGGEDATLSTHVPIGNQKHAPLVLAATGVAMLGATLSIAGRLKSEGYRY